MTKFRPLNSQPSTINLQRCCAAFTLIELLIVVGIMAILLVLIAPAFTTIRGGADVTSAAYTIKGVLDTARTYAKANNTYTWVGFIEENVANPASPNSSPPPVGRLIMSIVASTDGTTVYDPNNPATIDPTRLSQVGKLTKIENVHLYLGPINSTTPFQYPVGNPAPSAQYTFVKAIQFSPRGEARINNSTLYTNGTAVGTAIFPLQTTAKIGLEPTHGATIPGSLPPNSFTIQFTGVGGNITINRQ